MTPTQTVVVPRPARIAIRSPKQFCAGILFALIGVAALVVGLDYPVGAAARIGPGYFPVCLSLLLIALGLASAIRGLRVSDGPIGHWPIGPIVFVLAAVVAFAVLIDVTGLVESGVALILLCCYQRLFRRPLEVAMIAGFLLVFVTLLFVKFLQMPFAVF